MLAIYCILNERTEKNNGYCEMGFLAMDNNEDAQDCALALSYNYKDLISFCFERERERERERSTKRKSKFSSVIYDL